MTRAEAARRYLQASMAAHTTALPGEAKAAHEETMARLEREHPGAAELAAIGANSDFDRHLSRNEREHQAHLRGGASPNELKARRDRARSSGRGPSEPRRSSTRRPGPVRAGVAGGRGYARARRAVGSSSGIADGGSLLLQSLGVGIGLSLLYLALSPNGSKGFSTLLGGLTKFLTLFVSAVDPLHPGTHAAPAPAEPGSHVQPGGAVAASPVQRAKLNPRFGPGPGIGTPIAPVGVAP